GERWLKTNVVWVAAGLAAAAVIAAVLLRSNRWSIAALVAIALALIRIYPNEDGHVDTVRSFFGVHKIQETADGRYHVLLHGTTIHGAQMMRNGDGSPSPAGRSRSPTITTMAASVRRSPRCASARVRHCA